MEVGVSIKTGVVVGVDEGVTLFNDESLRLEAGDAGADPAAPVPLSHELLLVSGSEDDGERRRPGDNRTTGTWAKCSVGIRIYNKSNILLEIY